MSGYKVLAVVTKYWKPGENYPEKIVGSIEGKISNGDFLVVSEKAISTATNNILDESKVEANSSARLIAKFWMRVCWGYFLGLLCHFQKVLIRRLREYPVNVGSRHKQVALQHAGLLQALMYGSEGGIDGSNLPYSYVSLPLNNAGEIAERIHKQIQLKLRKKVLVIITDTDKTYSYRNFHFTPRPRPIKGIHSLGGFLTYVIGRIFRFERRATPIAVAGGEIPIEKALRIAEVANRARGFGAGRNVWEMADRFQVQLTGVNWEMLDTVKHKPIVILRTNR